jgi:mannosyltransferase
MWPDYGYDERFPSFGGNFEIVKLARFHSPDITAFLEELASDPKRFYTYRWTA